MIEVHNESPRVRMHTIAEIEKYDAAAIRAEVVDILAGALVTLLFERRWPSPPTRRVPPTEKPSAFDAPPA